MALELFFRHDNEPEKSFDLICKADKNWKTSKHRFLVIAQHVTREDLKNKELLSTKEWYETFQKFLKESRKIARRYENIPEFSYAIINFNNANVVNLKDDRLAERNIEFNNRVQALIKRLKPTHVLIAGTSAPRYVLKTIFPELENIDYKRGSIFEKDGVKYTATVDIFRVLTNDEYANTIGFGFQHAANLMIGYHPYDLSKINVSYKYIRTIEEFDQMLDLLYKSKYVGYDLETRSLAVNNNAIYTAQFTSNLEPERSYIITLDHPQTHWNKEELVYFKKKLRKFFSEKGRPFLITYNGMFDLRITRQCLRLPIINRECWELMAGEHDLDENVNKLTTVYGVPQGNLRACLCRYNNDFYFKNAFTKEDRSTIGNVAIDDHDVLMYCAADSVFAVAIFKMQLKRAEDFLVKDRTPYKKYFIAHMLGMMSPTAHTLSHLRQDGSYIDMDYMAVLRSKDSPLAKQLNEVQREMFSHPQVKEANKLLLDRAGFKSTSLWGDAANDQWILTLTKPEHRSALFFDVMQLKPVSYTKTGEPAIDEAFREAYKYSNAVVSMFDDYQQINKLLNTYVKAWNKILTLKDADAIKDHRLRPDYAFYNVLTGRLGSRNPSLQVIPQHSNIAKHIKRAFIASPGQLLIHYDYNAQEVRTWGIVAHDDKIADTFRIGQKLRQKFIKEPTEENKERIKKEGDVHCLNVKTFFNRVVDKKHPLRALVKGVVFATIYLMSPKSMGEQIKGADIIDAKNKIHDAWEKTQDKSLSAKDRALAEVELSDATDALQALLAEDRTELAQSTMDKVFASFKKGKQWIDDTVAMAKEYGYTMSPVGRIRHVPAALVVDKKTQHRMIRQSCNAPIQGFASEMAVKASRIATQCFYDHAKEISAMLGLPYKSSNKPLSTLRIVHDANYASVDYEFVIPFLHIMQYCATYGTADAIEKEFNFKFNIEPEIEMELGTCDSGSGSGTWDWSVGNLLSILHTAVHTGYKDGFIHEEPKDVIEKILAPWRNKECRAYLNENFPILGVKDMNEMIEKALNDYDAANSETNS